MTTLLDPVTIGELRLPNRIVMAPLTRNRSSGPGRVPNELMREYYTQRASAGLIISEATSVTPMGVGYPHTPGVWSREQVEGWRQVTKGVHAAGGRILLQLWHVGRISDPVYLDGALPVAPSAIAPKGHVSMVRPDKPYVVPRALALDEIQGVVEAFRMGTENAKEAGFDGVEIHGANGYLLDQFTRDGTNKRTDAYGGSVKNRARFPLEVTEAVVGVWGPGRVGYRIAPNSPFNSMADSNPVETFSYLAAELDARDVVYLHVVDPAADGDKRISPILKEIFDVTYIVNGGFDAETADAAIRNGEADLVAFGVPFLANPDLPERYRQKAPLNAPDQKTFYAGEAKGYTDYPALV
jgi:2,4-dienoyl-CoA reductase-like NADH-dependent reductase (Old Yellow Enzyme family)